MRTRLFLSLIFLFQSICLSQSVQYVARSHTSRWWHALMFWQSSDSKRTVTLPKLVGEWPQEIEFIIHQLRHPDRRLIKLPNRLILHGPPGNGKTSLASAIAGAAGARYFFSHKGSTIVQKYVGSGAQAIEDIFRSVEDSIDFDQSVILFIDEIEQIAANNTTEFRAEHDAALRTLWLNLDKFKNEPNFLFICATNNFKALHPTFVDRFGNNVIEIKNPDTALRKSVIEHYFKQVSVVLEPGLLDAITRYTKNLSVRSIEDSIKSVMVRAQLDNQGIVTEDIIWHEIGRIKKRNSMLTKLYELADDKDQLQKLFHRVSLASGVISSAYYLVLISKMLWSKNIDAPTVAVKGASM